MTTATPKTKIVYNDRLFYNKYTHCLTAGLLESYVLHKLTHSHIDSAIAMRRKWLEDDYFYSRASQRGISDKMADNLHKFCQLLNTTTHQFKLVLEFNSVRLYANTDVLFKDILASDVTLGQVRIKQVFVNRPKDTILLTNPRHTHRSYLKRAKLTDREKIAIKQMLINNEDTLRTSPAMVNWINSAYNWTDPHFFIDHNEVSWMIMLSLIHPHLIRKTYEIIRSL